MSSSYVVDRAGALGKLQRTATGGYRVPATLARAGVLSYSDGKGGTVRHYNPPEVLQASLSDIGDVPVTYNHPKEMVTPATYRNVAVGHVLGSPTFTDGHVHAVLAFQDSGVLAALETGAAREISMGYSIDYDPTPGVTPEGEVYDVVRTGIRWNHIALVPEGRAGRSVRCMLDSNEIPVEVEVFLIDGAEVAQDAAQKAIDALCAERDAARAELATVKDALATATSAEALDAAIRARDEAAAAAAAEAKLLQDAADRRNAVVAAFPTLDLEGKSQDYVDALHAVMSDGMLALTGKSTVKDAAPPAAPKVSARERMLRSLRG